MSIIGLIAIVISCIWTGIATSEIEPIWLRRVTGAGIGAVMGATIMLTSWWVGLP
jgi:hypothetical protein